MGAVLVDLAGATINWTGISDRITFYYGNNSGVIQAETQVATLTPSQTSYRHNFTFPLGATFVCYYVYLGSARSEQGCNQVVQPTPSPTPSPTPDPCAQPGTCSVTLTWNPPDSSSGQGIPTGYRVYYGPASRGYTTSNDAALNLTYLIPNFSGPRTVYFAVTAYNNIGESPFSNEAWKAFPSCCTAVTFMLKLK
jgi:hypothetical protein